MTSEKLNNIYTPNFYSAISGGSLLSASAILGRLFEIYEPNSVIDFGCGIGMWLSVAESLGSAILKGYDGDWVQQDKLLSKAVDFTPVNMEQDIEVSDRYDLAISVEVAEHLSERRAKSFVNNLCKASDVVLFGAAIKHQCGANHINEQWQSYWIKLFEMNDYECFDIVRAAVWNNESVEWWYRQNTFLFVNQKNAEIDRGRLRSMETTIYDIVHPSNYEEKIHAYKQTYKALQMTIEEPTLRFCLGVAKRLLFKKLGLAR